MSHRPGLNSFSNVAQVQFGTCLVMICIATRANFEPSFAVLTWKNLGASATLTRFFDHAGTSPILIQFAFSSIASAGNVIVVPNAAFSPETLYRFLLLMKSNAALLR